MRNKQNMELTLLRLMLACPLGDRLVLAPLLMPVDLRLAFAPLLMPVDLRRLRHSYNALGVISRFQICRAAFFHFLALHLVLYLC